MPSDPAFRAAASEFPASTAFAIGAADKAIEYEPVVESPDVTCTKYEVPALSGSERLIDVPEKLLLPVSSVSPESTIPLPFKS